MPTTVEDAKTKARNALKNVSSGSAHVGTFKPAEAALMSEKYDGVRAEWNGKTLDASRRLQSGKMPLLLETTKGKDHDNNT
ncbi:MAG: hypothetical protein WC003_14910 [Terrimicrobiaceae bacterium]